MIIVSIVFGAVSTFVPLYTVKYEFANAGIFLTIQAIAVVLARIYLRKHIPSDGLWHPLYMVNMLMLLTMASMLVAIGPHLHVVIFLRECDDDRYHASISLSNINVIFKLRIA